ncbi:hypothetical protein NHP22001_09440 [Helicobacter sp. NHP22-001]|nr:hypothetical protein NHP22001_09440 [Helicobacter sp. NHP22-001]
MDFARAFFHAINIDVAVFLALLAWVVAVLVDETMRPQFDKIPPTSMGFSKRL